MVAMHDEKFQYDGWEMDAEDRRPVIQDFLDHAE